MFLKLGNFFGAATNPSNPAVAQLALSHSFAPAGASLGHRPTGPANRLG